jgi:protein-L-isoaspartate(D-aspartate) O-methyltransferase
MRPGWDGDDATGMVAGRGWVVVVDRDEDDTAATEPGRLRRELLAVVRGRGGARDDAVAEALLAVPRHLFVPDVTVEDAYRDDAIVTRRDDEGVPISSSSQPTIMAIMLDQLGVASGHRVLEIGAGTGYNAALLGHLVGPGGAVVSVDIDQAIVDGAAAHLAAAGYPRVTVVCRDGADGYAPGAPYDRIIATVGVWDLAPAWLEQLAPGGRIVVPLDLHGAQVSVAFERQGARWVSRSRVPCGFMRLRGSLAGPGQTHVLDRGTGLRMIVPDDRYIDAEAVTAALVGQAVITPTRVSGVEPHQCFALSVWSAITDERWCGLSDEDPGSPALAAALLQAAGFNATPGVIDGTSVALLGRRAAGDGRYEVDAHGFGPDGERLAAELAAHVRSWDAAGRPDVDQLRITAYPRGTASPDGGIVIEKAHTRLVVEVSNLDDAAPA